MPDDVRTIDLVNSFAQETFYITWGEMKPFACINFEIAVVCGRGLFKRAETFFAPLDSSGREIRKYTRLLGITSEIHKAARYHEWGNDRSRQQLSLQGRIAFNR